MFVIVVRYTHSLVKYFQVVRDMVSSRRRGTIREDEDEPFTNQLSSLF